LAGGGPDLWWADESPAKAPERAGPGDDGEIRLAAPSLQSLGVMSNTASNGQAIHATFDGASVLASTVFVKYSYYGDADLSGQVDGSDYSRIDNGFLNHLTGWSNGDFNYDGIINGSDYTLIDNAFNRQGAALPSVMVAPQATAAAQIASTTTHTQKNSAIVLPAHSASTSVYPTASSIQFSNVPIEAWEQDSGKNRDLIDRLNLR
jgi:hypothetical protein